MRHQVRLTPDQIAARHALITRFRDHLTTAMWEVIEGIQDDDANDATSSLLASDDGTPYAAIVSESLRTSPLDQMVRECVGKACKHMENWL